MSQNNNQNNDSGLGKVIAVILGILVMIWVCTSSYSYSKAFLNGDSNGDKKSIEIPIGEIHFKFELK